MKMTNLLLLTVALMLAGVTAQAQNTFFPTKAGIVQVYAHKNAKGQVESHTRQTVKNVEGSGGNMTISYAVEALDKNQKSVSDPPIEMSCTVVVKDYVIFMDMNQMFLGQLSDMGLKMEVTGVPMELPGNMQPGQTLKDANMSMSIDMGIMKMRTDIKMTDGKCLAIEETTVPAGTFTCYKVTQTVTTTVMRRDVVSTTVTWYVPGVGTIKTESYDNRNRLSGSTELIAMNN